MYCSTYFAVAYYLLKWYPPGESISGPRSGNYPSWSSPVDPPGIDYGCTLKFE